MAMPQLSPEHTTPPDTEAFSLVLVEDAVQVEQVDTKEDAATVANTEELAREAQTVLETMTPTMWEEFDRIGRDYVNDPQRIDRSDINFYTRVRGLMDRIDEHREIEYMRGRDHQVQVGRAMLLLGYKELYEQLEIEFE